MSRDPDDEDQKKQFEIGLNNALDRSDHELIHLANFYHEHGYPEYAQEIYRSMFKMRGDRNQQVETELDRQREGEAS